MQGGTPSQTYKKIALLRVKNALLKDMHRPFLFRSGALASFICWSHCKFKPEVLFEFLL